MAKINSPFSINGKVGGLSVYNLRGVGLVSRQPFGPSSHDIQTKDSYNITRRNTSEHGGCSTASKWLRRNFRPLEPARDYPMSGPVTGWLKPFLLLDTESEFGRRHVLLSKDPRLLEGINLSTRYPFDSVVRGGISYDLDRAARKATVSLPDLISGVSFSPAGKHPYYRVVAALGVAPDIFWTPLGYAPAEGYEQLLPQVAASDWFPTAQGSEAFTLEATLPYTLPNESFCLVLTLGIVMGAVGRGGRIEAAKYAGSAKVLAAG